MDENLRRIHQYLEYKFEEIENILLLASYVFNRLEQAVYEHTEHDSESITADECRARAQESTILINLLQVLREGIDQTKKAYEMIVCEVKNQNHPILLHRLERDIELKIRYLLCKVLHNEFLVHCYRVKLQLRQIMSNFARNE
ncbi:hypothetical protein CEXT_69421 [Caerostris extrusa]|uniref:Uncharacterized protein n=1 Tax=Caerostris extrusa TaxID=172846 RepID=A0AAV4R4H3_CAEEX|nr:hypothetical protein CEXT_69421 [Caerostris extrusa]